MPEPILKKCFNCRIFLPDDAVNTSQCQKCQKNEAKYGVPGTCQYCKLNAAFHDQKCVWCSHAERKYGTPFSCQSCKLQCGFAKKESEKYEGAPLLCRLCILQARHTGQTSVAGIPIPPEKPEKNGDGSSAEQKAEKEREKERHRSSRHHKDKDHRRDDKRHREHREHRSGHKRRHEESNNNGTSSSSSGVPPLTINNENGHGFPPFGERDHGENMEKQHRMEDEIRRLKAAISEKDQLLFDKDKQISNLKADQYNLEKKHRERVQQLIKEKEDSIRAIEHMRSSKSSKKN
ncbi:hypothetical protein GCK72_002757 [Caenorhabditis remanei]|uniref:Uncharacterized protein n=1 Tax=Caenorhabditis remanei TaxID=31234 RepID=E3NKD6_CAERE|nr:hypothetical protein GCK72_002757 [Caenorhabditis remanei]EFP02109.1 hypothetical protein CRE_20595 [Caenorhabditis remanei]KAF1770933.1 hypothetical protein GCK72_002757 [Caenorhabditis remanei]